MDAQQEHAAVHLLLQRRLVELRPGGVLSGRYHPGGLAARLGPKKRELRRVSGASGSCRLMVRLLLILLSGYLVMVAIASAADWRDDPAIERRIDALLGEMTLAEKPGR